MLECVLGTVYLHGMPNKFGATICDEAFGSPKAGHNFLANKAGNGGGSVVGYCPGHWPASEPHNVEGPLLKGLHSLDGQDRFGGCRFGRVFFAQHTHFKKVQDILKHVWPPNLLFHDLKEVRPSDVTQGLVVVHYCGPLLCGGDVRRLLTCLCLVAEVISIGGSEAGELPPEAGKHRQKDFLNGGEWIGTAKSPVQENDCFHAAFLKQVDINNFVVLFIIPQVKPVPCAHLKGKSNTRFKGVLKRLYH
ncbi:hypothetical protein DSO57_1017730 [Entomophthora muscae]|uniref:Uncharacterized protein n=1 Tax=Entomophthora muscae TaxID=34485 RepID=A0ACC2TF95_9FUNG|nr:hypothetical protein DSO57_1017730 [Entomophthora muscae]